MEMSQMYDENILDNKFFQKFCDLCPALFQSAIEQEWLICIPKVGTFESHELKEQDCLSHVLIHVSSDKDMYKTASDKHVIIESKILKLGQGFDVMKEVNLLFSETFYSDTQKRYQVLCVDQPLSFECADLSSQPQNSMEFRIQNVDDAIILLFAGQGQGQGSSLKRSLDRSIATHQMLLSCPSSELSAKRYLIDTMQLLFTKCLQYSLKDSHLKRRLAANKYMASNVKQSVETYINHSLYTVAFKYLCTAVGSEDARLNKINRNLAQAQLTDLGITSKFSANIPRARKELLDLNKFSTPLAKMACIKRVITALMQNPQNVTEIEPLTVDDLLPMLVLLIIRSSIPSWTANFIYMTQFHFSKSSSDEYSFYMSTLEAALEYVKSGDLTRLVLSGGRDKRVELSPSKSSPKLPTISRLFEYIRFGDVTEVRTLLERTTTSGPSSGGKVCHPLCSCDVCEKQRSDDPGEESYVTVFSRDDRGFTALHQAAMFDQTEVIECLKDLGGVIDATDYHGSTPLHIACQRGNQSATMMLIFCEADINSSDNDGNHPLHVSALNGHEECIKALLFQEASQTLDINAANEHGDTALHLAVKWSYESITRLLLEHGASPEARNRYKYTPMMLVSDGRIATLITKAIEMLQEKANDGFIEVSKPSSPEADSVIPIMSDIHSISIPSKTLSPRRKITRKVKRLLKAVSDCDIEMLKHVMGWGEPSNDSSSAGSADEEPDVELCHPLCQCRRCAHTQKVQASLVDINSSDEQGRTSLHIAVEKNSLDIVQLLLTRHADVNCKTDLIQFTPLHLACQQLAPNQTVIQLLIEHGAKVNCKDCNGRCPLHFASQTGSYETTLQLLKAGANVHAINYRGNSPLHEAAKVNNHEIVKLLISYNANPTLVNKNGLRPIQLTNESNIIKALSDCMDEQKYQTDREKVTSVPTGGKPVNSPRADNSATQKRIFAALEADDVKKLHQLMADINSFNKKSLRRTITRDLSSPLLSISSLSKAQALVDAVSGHQTRDEALVRECSGSRSAEQAHCSEKLSNVPIISDKESHDESADLRSEACIEDLPECDYHLDIKNFRREV